MTDDEWLRHLLTFPSERRFDYEHPLALRRLQLHRDAMTAGEDVYRDPETGALVLCASTLRERGFCCSLGCRHCPYTGGRRPYLPGVEVALDEEESGSHDRLED